MQYDPPSLSSRLMCWLRKLPGPSLCLVLTSDALRICPLAHGMAPILEAEIHDGLPSREGIIRGTRNLLFCLIMEFGSQKAAQCPLPASHHPCCGRKPSPLRLCSHPASSIPRVYYTLLSNLLPTPSSYLFDPLNTSPSTLGPFEPSPS